VAVPRPIASIRALLSVIVALIVSALMVGLSGCSIESAKAHAGPTVPRTTPEQALAAAVVFNPGNGATGVAPNASVSVEAPVGQLSSVSVLSSSGDAVPGSLDPQATTWTSDAALAPQTRYTVTAVVTGPNGLTATAHSTFTTLTPTALVGVSVWPEDVVTVGVGQPIVLRFTQPEVTPSARTGVLGHLHLSLSNPVPVGAYWFSPYELHLRPEHFWPSGEQVAFSYDLDGWNAGSGEWGQGSGSVRFSIGAARISVANLETHEMTVTENGRTVATYPISAGRAQYPTMDGIHIVLDRESQVQMISSTVGIPVNSPDGYDETVYWDVHISDSGEYVHSAPWSVADQGSINVSHGCINLSPANAEAFFNFSRVGDVVEVINGPRAPVPGDHGVMDWSTVPWSAFTPFPVSKLS
jgi:lipoprotein-anchoring transpeptidase ErfK/SrfK/uncharacterized protein with FMN-binding domain